MYLVLGLLAAFENVFPPLPSDAAIALGAFLSSEGVTRPLTVFLVVWAANVAGLTAVYALARRVGRGFLETRAGRRLIPVEALATVEREYLRFGAAGLFLARLVPGVRAVAPPFAGIVGLGAVRALVPLALASGAWYALVTGLGVWLGSEWQRVTAILARVNVVLAVVGGLAAAAGAFAWWRRRERRLGARRERLWAAVHAQVPPGSPAPALDPRVAALLMLEVAYDVDGFTADDRAVVERHLRERWGLAPDEEAAPPGERRAVVRWLQAKLGAQLPRAARLALVEQLWQTAFRDGELGAYEAILMQRAAGLLGLDADEARRVREQLGGGPPP